MPRHDARPQKERHFETKSPGGRNFSRFPRWRSGSVSAEIGFTTTHSRLGLPSRKVSSIFLAQSSGTAWRQIVINICVGRIKRNAYLGSVLLDPMGACRYICAEYGAPAKNERPQAKQAASHRLSPRDTEYFSADFRELGESVAWVLRNGGTCCIQTRGKDGSQKQKEESQ